MNQTELNLRPVDYYNIYDCAGCGEGYKMPVPQWKGMDEQVLPAHICPCGLDCWIKRDTITRIQAKNQFISSWETQKKPQTTNKTIINITLIGATAATTFMSTLLPHLSRLQ